MSSRLRFSTAVLLSLLSLLLLAACGMTEQSKIRAVIEEYNDLLPAAYARAQPDLLANVASEAERNRVLMYVLYLRKEGEAIESRLVSLEFVAVRVTEGGTKATAQTRETWEYRMLDSETGAPKGEFREIAYESTYELTKGEQGWIVESLDARETSPELESQ